jgi:hypothetical protein
MRGDEIGANRGLGRCHLCVPRASCAVLSLYWAGFAAHSLVTREVFAGELFPVAAEAHWSFRPIKSPRVPTPRNAAWVKNTIDAFILDRLEREKLTPAPGAERLSLLRRLKFDLVGLPPTPEDVEEFLQDSDGGASLRLIDRLLASNQYGERWGRRWLDVARYADSGGFEADLFYPNAWRYRDYVIRSLNGDKSVNRFIEEQVAGDELWPDDRDAAIGATFYGIGPVLPEAASTEGQLELEWRTDAADTTGAAFLGLTFGCARCHDHKYDPISQRDYYAMQAIFAATDRTYPDKVRLNRIKALNGLLSDAPVPKELMSDPRCTVEAESKAGHLLIHRDQPVDVHRLKRGELSKPAEVMDPGLPRVFFATNGAARIEGVGTNGRRAALARWLTSRDNPLTARVFVNRVWAWHFGRGLVSTPNDFGIQGDPPSHPELLDWLAADVMEHGWSLKRLNRLIVSSSTYQMSSVAAGRGLTSDPEDTLLWHFPRQRLEGEAIRDAMLACSGKLNTEMGGPPVVPPLDKDELTGLFDASDKWRVTKDKKQHDRRSVYLLSRRTFVYPMFAAFDAPEVMTSCAQRMHTTVPTQALTLLNSPLAREQAVEFAWRLARECPGNHAALARRAWLLAFGRPITAAEQARVTEFLAAKSADAGGKSSIQEQRALAELCLALFNANEFSYID